MARINGVYDNNHLQNLYWSTPIENDKSYHGRIKRGRSLDYYLITAEVIEIRTNMEHVTIALQSRSSLDL
ncbi:hypothetical protein ACQVP2_31945 [Methylobacterium aquaticum]|uniref:hypothetical protein n=1 Tax=Methylobacterium aquaticum TaxID=270351 RepID=UPI003D172F74